jgi:hypothetical protein
MLFIPENQTININAYSVCIVNTLKYLIETLYAIAHSADTKTLLKKKKQEKPASR